MAECKHAATPLSSCSINTTHQGFQKRYITLFYLKELKSYQQKCKRKVRFTKENGLESFIPLLKDLMSGINAVGAQGSGCMFTLCHAPLKWQFCFIKQTRYGIHFRKLYATLHLNKHRDFFYCTL